MVLVVPQRLCVSEVDPVLDQIRSGLARVELESPHSMLHGIV